MLRLVCNDIFFPHYEIKWAQTTCLKAQTNGVNSVLEFKIVGSWRAIELIECTAMVCKEFFHFSRVSIRKVDFWKLGKPAKDKWVLCKLHNYSGQQYGICALVIDGKIVPYADDTWDEVWTKSIRDTQKSSGLPINHKKLIMKNRFY